MRVSACRGKQVQASTDPETGSLRDSKGLSNDRLRRRVRHRNTADARSCHRIPQRWHHVCRCSGSRVHATYPRKNCGCCRCLPKVFRSKPLPGGFLFPIEPSVGGRRRCATGWARAHRFRSSPGPPGTGSSSGEPPAAVLPRTRIWREALTTPGPCGGPAFSFVLLRILDRRASGSGRSGSGQHRPDSRRPAYSALNRFRLGVRGNGDASLFHAAGRARRRRGVPRPPPRGLAGDAGGAVRGRLARLLAVPASRRAPDRLPRDRRLRCQRGQPWRRRRSTRAGRWR